MGAPRSIIARSWRADERGFTVVEAIVALMVLGIIFTALAYTMMGSIRASLNSRLEQQAIDLATQQLEQARDMDYAALNNVSTDLAGDSLVSSCSGKQCFNGEVILTATGGIAAHKVTHQSDLTNNATFTTAVYVTDPADSLGADYKRVTVVTTWQSGQLARERRISSLVAFTQRGLPLPVFKLTPTGATTVAANPGTTVVFGFSLTNQGAPDRWNLTTSGQGTWTLVKDDGDGIWEPLVDTVALTDSSSDGTPDTGLMPATTTFQFWMVQALPGPPAADQTQTAAITATSVSQPEAASGVISVPVTVQVVNGTISATPTPSITNTASPTATTPTPTPTTSSAAPTTSSATPTTSSATPTTSSATPTTSSASPTGTTPSTCPTPTPTPAPTAASGYNLRAYKLHYWSETDPDPTPTPTGPWKASASPAIGMPLTMTVGAATLAGPDVPIYSYDLASTLRGRIIKPGGGGATTDPAKFVAWKGNTAKMSYSGTAALSFWVAADTADPGTGFSVTAQLLTYKNGYQSTLGSAAVTTAPTWACDGGSGWQRVDLALPSFTKKITATNEYIAVKLWNTGSKDVRIAYDVTGTFEATLTLPEQ